MAEVNPPLFMTVNDAYYGDSLAMLARDSVGEGVVSPDSLVVTAGPGMSVNVSSGACYIEGDDAPQQPTYRCYSDGTRNLALAPADPHNGRFDIVIASVSDVAFGGTANEWRLSVLTGTPGAYPVDPALPPSAIKLASVYVPAGSLTPGQIVDTRPEVNYDKTTVGAVRFFLGPVPFGYLALNGAPARRDKYARLFELWGTQFGVGDGTTTFGVPDFRDRFPVGAGVNYAVGDVGGAATVVLATGHMPPHNHGGYTSTMPPHSHVIGQVVNHVGGAGTWGGYLFNPGGPLGYGEVIDANARTSDELPHNHAIPTEGLGWPHENRPPYMAGIWAVRT